MKMDKFDGSLTACRWKSLLLATMLWGTFAGTLANAKTPKPYCDPSGLKPSSRCTEKFRNHVYLPTPTSKSRNTYVLLLVFDSETDADAAGRSLFYADMKDNDKPATWSCVEDPPGKGKRKAVSGWGLVVKGSCPKDCTARDLKALREMQFALRQKSEVQEPDPLANMEGHPHWAILPAGDEDAGVRVWQIRAADAVHAAEILESLSDRLKATSGYKGYLLIAYTPGLHLT